MRKGLIKSFRIVLVIAAVSPFLRTWAEPQVRSRIDQRRVAMSFEENRGQSSAATLFVTHGAGYSAEFARQSVRIRAGRTTVTMTIPGSNPDATIEGADPQPGSTNYLIGSDPSAWITHIPHYGKVRYRNIYPFIDLVFYGAGGQLEYDFLVHEGGDPSRIRTQWRGVKKIQIDANDDLVLDLSGGKMKWRRPAIYQERGGSEDRLEGGFAIVGKNVVGFAIPDYDRRKPLVIDPVLQYATFLGGSAEDVAFSLWVDAAGDAYAAGYSQSTDFLGSDPHGRNGRFTNYSSVGFVTKIDPTGTQNLGTTYIVGSAVTQSSSVAVTAITGDSSGNIYVGGIAGGSTNAIPFTSNAFQKTLNGSQNGWVAKLSSDLSSIQYCSWLGGNTSDGVADGTNGIAVDSAGNLYVAGYTSSSAQSPANPKGFYVTSNAVQKQNNGGGDNFLVKIDPTGSTILYSTFLGGSSLDHPFGVAVDTKQQMYITGYTRSCDYPVLNAYQSSHAGACTTGMNNNADIFLTVITADGSGYVYSTYLGGDNEDRGRAIYVDAQGDAFLTGDTESPTHEPPWPFCSAALCTPFPTTSNAFQPIAPRCSKGGTVSKWSQAACAGGDADVIITEFGPTGALVYSTYYGGTLGVQAAEAKYQVGGCSASTAIAGCGFEKGLGIVVQETGTDAGSIYVAGTTTSTDFPMANATQAQNAGGYDAFVVKIKADGNGPLFSTYFGGTGDDYAYALGRDGSFNVYAAGWATPPANGSTTFFPDNPQLLYPYAGGDADAFLFKIANTHIEVVPVGYFLGSTGSSPALLVTTGVMNTGRFAADQTKVTTIATGLASFSSCQTNAGTCSVSGNICSADFGTVPPGQTDMVTCVSQVPPNGSTGGTNSNGASSTNDPDPTGKNTSGTVTGQPGSGGVSCAPSLNGKTDFPAAGGQGTITVMSPCGSLGWIASNPMRDWMVPDHFSGQAGTPFTFTVAANDTVMPRQVTLTIANVPLTITQQPGAPPPTGLGFFAITPCRTVDTRISQPKTGAFGPPSLVSSATRDFPLLSSGCGLPMTAQAYSLNFTVVPPGPVDYLSSWPSGQSYPGVSTLNSTDGSTLANAAIVPAGTNGAITVLSGKQTDLIIDANGYFAPSNGSELAFYPVRPCRVADTRASQGFTGAFGPPSLVSNVVRDFPIQSGGCNLPSIAQAYSLNITAVPSGQLQYVSVWPTGQPYPNVSTLNSNDGSIAANAAIVPAGMPNGSIRVLPGGNTDLIIDVNGYFGPPGGAGALHFYPVAPCRVADTRTSQPFSGSLGPPSLVASVTRDLPILSGKCNIPAAAQAYSLNFTAVPQGPLPFLSVWPTGQAYPNVSTLNSPKGTTLANAAIVPAGANGSITVMSAAATDLIIDINGYFAP